MISVFSKDRLSPIIQKLNELGISIYSTGGTQKFIEGEGVKVSAVEDLTSYPSILGGRVKTLHPKVFGGILGRRELKEDLAQLEQYEIPEIDLVIVDLYPFEDTVASGASEADIIEKIDIGGISLIRAAAKELQGRTDRSFHGIFTVNWKTCWMTKKGFTDVEDRKKHLLPMPSTYPPITIQLFSSISAVVRQGCTETKRAKFFSTCVMVKIPTRMHSFYGKNGSGISNKLHGKELSYNNLAGCRCRHQPDARFWI